MEAAVALIRVTKPSPEYLILRRAHNEKDPWSGHFSLPGGRRDPGDMDLLATCLRETHEECGFRLSPENLVCPLPMAVAGTVMGRHAQVTPFLFELEERPDLVLDPREISEYHWVHVEYLLDRSNHLEAATLPQDPERFFPAIPLAGGYLWGFTYKVLQDFLGF